jgi:hypothetical protein
MTQRQVTEEAPRGSRPRRQKLTFHRIKVIRRVTSYDITVTSYDVMQYLLEYGG